MAKIKQLLNYFYVKAFCFDDAKTGCKAESILQLHYSSCTRKWNHHNSLFSLVIFRKDKNDAASWHTCASDATVWPLATQTTLPYSNNLFLCCCRFNETFHFLFWTMFGVANQDYVDMPEFVLAEFVGRILYGIFTLVIVIVLLNMLIAMITNSFQKIEVRLRSAAPSNEVKGETRWALRPFCSTCCQDDADVEWKFARSKLYLSYFREGLTMPVPFNIIPSPKAVFYILRWVLKIKTPTDLKISPRSLLIIFNSVPELYSDKSAAAALVILATNILLLPRW